MYIIYIFISNYRASDDELRAEVREAAALAGEAEQDNEAGLIKLLRSRYKEKSEEHGFKDTPGPPLQTSIAMMFWMSPLLHIKLGLTKSVLEHLLDFNRECTERFPEVIVNAKNEVTTAQQNMDKIIADMNAFTSAHDEIGKQRHTAIKDFNRHSKAIRKWHDYVNESTRLVAKNAEDYATACTEMELVNIQLLALCGQVGQEGIEILTERNRVRSLEAAALNESKKLAVAALKNAKNRLDSELKKTENRPVEAAIEDILTLYGIVRQVYHGQSLIGEHCHRLLHWHEIILEKITEVLKDATLRRVDTADDIDERIDEYIRHLRDLMGAMDYAFSVSANQDHVATDEECDTFEQVCKFIGSKWRSFLKLSCPPKLHMLESHMWVHLRRFRNLGVFGEDPVERLHNTDNKYNRLFNNIKTFKRAETAKLSRQSTENIPAVKEILTNQKENSKRKQSAATQEKKNVKKQRLDEIKHTSTLHVKQIAANNANN